MNKIIAFACLVLLLVTFTCAQSPDDVVAGVVELTNDNAGSVLDGSKYVLAEFYAPWCGHCKNLAPEYKKVGEAVEKRNPSDVVVAKVDCDKHRDVCSKYGVSGYPTLKFFPKGSTEPEDYTSGRTAEDIIDFLNTKARAGIRVEKPVTHVSVLDTSNFDTLVMNPDADVLVEFYAPWCGHCKKLAPDYEIVAKAFRNEKNVVVASLDADKYKELSTKYDVKGFPTIKFFPKGSSTKKPEDYNGGRSVGDFIKFLNEKSGAKRTESGLLNDEAGKVSALTDLVKKFLSSSGDAQSQIIEDAKKVEGDKFSVGYYSRVMQKIAEKGAEYIEKETARLARILESNQVADSMLDNLKARINILNEFKN